MATHGKVWESIRAVDAEGQGTGSEVMMAIRDEAPSRMLGVSLHPLFGCFLSLYTLFLRHSVNKH